MNGLRRHALVRLVHLPSAGHADDDGRVADWHGAGRPYVVARHGDDPRLLRLGFCTVDPRHPQLRPRRVAVTSSPSNIRSLALPPPLAEVVAGAQSHPRHAAMARLRDAAGEAGFELRIYGSWMWQTLTGEPHVHALSDLDVLVDVADLDAATRAAAFLARQEATTGMTLDGELHLAGVGDLSWREWRGEAPEVLVKTLGAMRLVPRQALRP